MKNLLIYINPRLDFDEETKILVKVQIDNSIDLGWKKEDILLVTNFPYEYNGIRSLVISGKAYCNHCPTATKITAIVELFKNNVIEKGQLYWSHDFDVFQNEVIIESEMEQEMADADMGLCDKGRMPRWNGGVIFFTENAKDIFFQAKKIMYKHMIDDERSLMALATNNFLWITEEVPEETIKDRVVPLDMPDIEAMKERIRKINITYNFRGWNIRSTYSMSIKPLRAIQFHPFDPTPYPGAPNALAFFMYGKNKINTVLMSKRLIKIFNKYGIS